jgi:hypothetical protein
VDRPSGQVCSNMSMPATGRPVERRTVPWGLIWEIGTAIRHSAKETLTRNLSRREQAEFRRLARKSRGRRGNLSEREQRRFVYLLRKGATGDGNASWFAVIRALPRLLPADAIPSAWEQLRKIAPTDGRPR